MSPLGFKIPLLEGGPSAATIEPPDPVEITTDPDLGAWTQGTALVDVAIEATGGTGPYTYAVTDGEAPTGVTVNSDGTVTGTPTAAGPFTFTVVATDSLMEESDPVVFTGTVTGVALTGDVADGLVGFRFSDYDPNTGTWTSYNDGTMLFEQGTESARPALVDEEVTFAGDDYGLGNAALRGYISGVDDLSLVAVVKITGATTTQFILNPRLAGGTTSNFQCFTSRGTGDRIEFSDYRQSGDPAGPSTAANSLPDDTPGLVAYIGRRASTAKAFATAMVTDADTTSDIATPNYSSFGVGGSGTGTALMTGTLRCVLVYNRELSDQDVTAIRAWLSNNAFYGCTGLTL